MLSPDDSSTSPSLLSTVPIFILRDLPDNKQPDFFELLRLGEAIMMSNVSITSKMYVDVGNKGRCPRQPYSPEAADTIAGWIKSVIQISSPTSTAKDCGLHQS
ncbi:2371_t:CDS:2 [Rhizophagus irregularis]|nr:2371_t:CDS:2 [Rhizophagus irregularis]